MPGSVLQALATPEWKERNWRLDLFGSGSDERYIQDVIRYFGLEDRVALCGYEREFRKIWMDHHLHILISRAEGLALALIESMFCGRPAVVTRTGGNHELVRDNKDGFVSAGENPEIIRETLERAWINRKRWPEMGEAAFQRANEWIPGIYQFVYFRPFAIPMLMESINAAYLFRSPRRRKC